MPLAPVSSTACFFNAHAQSCVECSARVHNATLLKSTMCLTNGQLRPPWTCVVLPMWHSKPWGDACCHQHHPTGTLSLSSPADTVHVLVLVLLTAHCPQWADSWCTMSARLWMDRFLLLHAISLASAFCASVSFLLQVPFCLHPGHPVPRPSPSRGLGEWGHRG